MFIFGKTSQSAILLPQTLWIQVVSYRMEHSKSITLYLVLSDTSFSMYIEREHHLDKTINHEIDLILHRNNTKKKAYSLIPSGT